MSAKENFDNLHPLLKQLVLVSVSDSVEYTNDMMCEQPRAALHFTLNDINDNARTFMTQYLDPDHADVELSDVVKLAISEIVSERVGFTVLR